jgi:hypothetical protein
MSNRKTTFRVSPARRPWFRRLTPLAWALVGVVGLVVVLGSIGGVLALGGCTPDEVWEPTPTSSPVPSDTPQPTQGPTATPTVWYEGLVTPTVTVEPAPVVSETIEFPAWWSDEMTQDGQGNWWPPEEVVTMVEEHYLISEDAYYEPLPEGDVPDLDALESALYDWYSGPQLETELDVLELKREGEVLIWQPDYEDLHLQVQNWSEDGLECTLGSTYQGIEMRGYDLEGHLVETMELDSQLVLWRMRYDPIDGHWKIHELKEVYQ